jgi:hypothetical protein
MVTRSRRALRPPTKVERALLPVVRRFVATAEDYLPDGNDDPGYSPEAELLANAKAALAMAERVLRHAKPKMKRFRVTIEQPLIHIVTVEAPDRDAAEAIASERYSDGDAFGRYDPPKTAEHSWGNFEVTDIDEVTS